MGFRVKKMFAVTFLVLSSNCIITYLRQKQKQKTLYKKTKAVSFWTFCHKPSQGCSSACSSPSSGSRSDCSSASYLTWVAKHSHSMTSGTLEKCETWFSPCRADGTQRARRRVVEWFADVSDVDGVVHGSSGVMVEQVFVVHNVN